MSYRNENISYPGPAWRPSQTFQPANHYERLRTDPNATELHWWRALPNVAFDPKSGRGPFAADADTSDDSQWTRELQSGGPYWAIIEGEKLLRRYFEPGSWETGSIAVLFNPNEFDLSEWDWIVQKGQGGAPGGAIDARTFQKKQTVVRGGTGSGVEGAGTVQITGTSVVGTDAAFTTFFRAGDVLRGPNNFAARVVSIANNTHLTLDAAPGAATLSGPYQLGRDYLLYAPAVRVSLLRDGNGVTYASGTDFTISPDGEFIQWLSPLNSPPPGVRYAVVYDYLTRYVVTDLGVKGAVVKGMPLLTLVAARLWKPEHNRR